MAKVMVWPGKRDSPGRASLDLCTVLSLSPTRGKRWTHLRQRNLKRMGHCAIVNTASRSAGPNTLLQKSSARQRCTSAQLEVHREFCAHNLFRTTLIHLAVVPRISYVSQVAIPSHCAHCIIIPARLLVDRLVLSLATPCVTLYMVLFTCTNIRKCGLHILDVARKMASLRVRSCSVLDELCSRLGSHGVSA